MAKVSDSAGIGAWSYLCACGIALVVLAALQYQYWYGDYGRGSLNALEAKIQAQDVLNEKQGYANSILLADVYDLKSGAFAIEEHARLDLGLIKSGEVFVQLSNAPVTFSHQTPTAVDDNIETVDVMPEKTP